MLDGGLIEACSPAGKFAFDVGTQAQFKKKKEPKKYRYESSGTRKKSDDLPSAYEMVLVNLIRERATIREVEER